MRRLLKPIALVSIGVLLVVIFVHRASRVEPSFYSDALDDPVNECDAHRIFASLDQKIETKDDWVAEMTDSQINSWLATELTKKFPGVLPDEARKPRIKIQDNSILLACQIRKGNLHSIFSVELYVQLTQRNEIQVELRKPRLGILPLPLSSYRSHLASAARRAQIPLRWPELNDRIAQETSCPIFFLHLPENRSDLRPGTVIDSLQLADGNLRLKGSSHRIVPTNSLATAR